ncbi:MAG: B12-binding domain-containing radical SAM protein [Syntrophaceae bacterium]|nr:B12-binding domain-containing radical SAM protein [Syntrophaceae bacterium]
MKIAFFNIAHEHVAIEILSAIAKKEGHTVRLLHTHTLFREGLTREFKRLANFFNYDRQLLFKQIEVYQPDLIAFSVVTYHYQLALYYAEICKNICPHAKIVFGGIHVSCVPDAVIANDFIDYVVIGEGEKAFTEIIRHIEKGCPPEPIVNTWYQSKEGNIIKGKQIGFLQDLDSLPHYDKDIWPDTPAFKHYYMTITSRGCPYNCSYCFNYFFRNIPDETSNYIRRRSVQHVIEELTIARKKYDIRLIEFWDDIFILDKKWLKDFLEAYKKEIAVPFKCYIHVKLFDEEVAIWLKDAGCKWVDFGIQHINEEYRRTHLKRYETNADIANTLKILKKHGIVSFADYIVALPGDTIEHNEEARLFFLENMPDIIEPYWMSYHPKTDIIKRGYELDILNDETMKLIDQGNDPNSYFASALGSQDFHQEYYFIFKVLPSLPVFLRKKLTYNVSKKIPYFIKILFYIYSILYLGYKHKSPRIKVVALYFTRYAFTMLKMKCFPKKRIENCTIK